MKISIYSKSGEIAATSYYRLYQYLYKINATKTYRKMIPDDLYKKVMPIYTKGLPTKAAIFFYILFRVQIQLIKDLIISPDILVISRRFINRTLPWSFKTILNHLKRKGTKIIWDFDDQIIVTKEITRKDFDYMSELSDYILVASPVNKDMVSMPYRNKVMILPTTDGDMYHLFNAEITKQRLDSFNNEIRLIWLGTSVSLEYVEAICPQLENLADTLFKTQNKNLILTVVCNENLNYKPKKLILRNIRWKREVAIQEALNSHVGLMPLEDTPKNQGKGGFKLIQYLSIGLPIAGSPVGINNDILTPDVGVRVNALDSPDWDKKIYELIRDKDTWCQMSQNAYQKWIKDFGFDTNLNIWRQLTSN